MAIVLEQGFDAIGADLRVRWAGNAFEIDVRREGDREIYQLQYPLGDTIQSEVLDVNPRLRHLVLDVTGWRLPVSGRYLCGHDERHWFVASLPFGRRTVRVAYAFQRAATQLLELDPRELGVLTVPTGEGGATRGAVIYDNVPGGAGHVRELLAIGDEWLAAARAAMYVSEDHDRRCESACLDCLLTFDAQRAMSQRPFVRRQALRCLDQLLGIRNKLDR